MADTKAGRDKQADDEERRQREREIEEARNRADEAKPPTDGPDRELGDLDEALETHNYPTTTGGITESYGDQTVETQDGSIAIDDVLTPIDGETYDSADAVRARILNLIHRG